MLTIEVRSNEKVLSEMFILNEGEISEGTYSYKVRYIRFLPSDYRTEFSLTHKRNEGHEKLIHLAYEELGKRLDTNS